MLADIKMWLLASVLAVFVGVSSALGNDEITLEYDYDSFENLAEARTFNLSLDGIFNSSILGIGAALIIGIILFGKVIHRVAVFTLSILTINETTALLMHNLYFKCFPSIQ